MQIPKRKTHISATVTNDPYLTQDKIAEFKKELDHLIRISRPKASLEVQELSKLGDFSENAAYQIAKGRLRGINRRIMDIK